MADDDVKLLVKAVASAEPSEDEGEKGEEQTEHASSPTGHVQEQVGVATREIVDVSPDGNAGENGHLEKASSPIPTYPRAVCDWQQVAVQREQERVSDHGGIQLASELDVVAVESLRQVPTEEPVERREIVLQMDTLHRSSTRRESFKLAMQSGKRQGEGDDIYMREDGAGTGITHNGDTTDTSVPALDPDIEEQGEGTSPGFQEMEILVDKEHLRQSRAWGLGKKFALCLCVMVMLGIALTIGLVSCSLVYVEYHQIALARSKLTGRVERRVTIYPGCHLLLPDTELIRFKGTAHTLLSDLEVSSSEGLVLRLKLSLQYFIKAEELGQLHRDYEENYEAVVRRVTESEVKNAAVHFSLVDYRLHRATVEQNIHRWLASRLEGNCCSPCCPKHCAASSQYVGHNCSTCSTSSDCQPGLHVSLLAEHLQLGAVELPQDVTDRYLRLALLQVETQKETFLQESRVERKLTQQQTRNILNQANEVRSAAVAEARRRGAEARVMANVLKDTAYIEAMKDLFMGLNITTVEHRLSLMLMLAFKDVGERMHLQQFNQLSLMGQETVV